MNKELEKLDRNERYVYSFKDVKLEINQNGFSLWDKERGKWILDASLYEETGEINIGDRKFTAKYVEILKVEEVEKNE